MTYYIKGGSVYNQASAKVYLFVKLAGYADGLYETLTDANIDADDPYLRLGSVSGGAKEVEIGLFGDYRIKIDATGIWGWDEGGAPAGWVNLIAGGAAVDLDDVCEVGATTDVVNITFTGASSEANSIKIGDGAVSCKIWSDGTDVYIKSSSGDIILVPTGGDVKCPATEKIWDACYN